MDNRVYLCDNLQLEKGLVQSFSGVGLNIFVKAAISLDASNVVCGSSDGNAYVWKVTFLTFNEILQVGYLGCICYGISLNFKNSG
ncbi:uncharacterized protein LOC114915809 isoform X1 [Cajanus cajan]|uniref:uncharacterized protein LOC114915809 isoform X1 n=1 Tax=Cajanus cajan TaxID=3821 RepID=UPI0010FAEFF0|nr:uncharacterized protein LOC114915809 isoform X1 [Cajanus cajan]